MKLKIILKNVNYLDPERLILKRGNIAVHEGKIEEITEYYDKGIDADDIFPGDNYIVFPGLVNSHIHPSKILYQGTYSTQPLSNILDAVHKNNQLEDPDTQYTASLLSLFNALKHGVTTFGIFTSRPLPDILAAKKTGIRSNICFCQNNVIIERGNYKTIADISDLIKEYNIISEKHEDYKTMISPATASELTASDDYIYRLKNLAKDKNRRFFMHLHEGEDTVNIYQRVVGCSAVENFKNKNNLSGNMTFIHLSHMSKNDISIIRNSNCAMIHCPSSNMYVGRDIMPLNLLHQNHLIGIGTDAAMINPSDSLTFESFLCLSLYSNPEQNSKFTAKSIWNMLTVNGAKVLGFDKLGMIRTGYFADMIFFDKNKITYPYINTPLSLLSLLHKEMPQRIMVNGEFINMENLYQSVNDSAIIETLRKFRRLMLF